MISMTLIKSDGKELFLSILILATWNTSAVALQQGLAEIGPKQLVGNGWKNAPLAEKTLFHW